MDTLPIRPIAETADTVTLSRSDYEALAELVTDARDLADADAVKARLTASETEAAASRFPLVNARRGWTMVPIRVENTSSAWPGLVPYPP